LGCEFPFSVYKFSLHAPNEDQGGEPRYLGWDTYELNWFWRGVDPKVPFAFDDYFAYRLEDKSKLKFLKNRSDIQIRFNISVLRIPQYI
jgi:hypothetical protein